MGLTHLALLLRNGRQDFEIVALVDTGCDYTILSRRMARAVRAPVTGAETLEVANGQLIRADVGRVRVMSRRLGLDSMIRVGITDVPFDVYPEEFLDMILGVDFLQRFGATLRFRGFSRPAKLALRAAVA